MAEENTTENTKGTAGEAVAAKKFGGVIKILVLVAVAMAGEAGLFLFLGVGSTSAVDAAPAEAVPVKDKTRHDDSEADLVEVEIHSFSVTNTTAAADTVIHISFKVHALLAADQENDFKKAVSATHKVRVRESIETIFRSATMEDLTDSSLSTLKRLVREEINRVLRQSYVVSIVFNDYKTIQQ
ncbi:MAG: flagellar basal body-associated FliL family protein [Rhodopirellula sp.]|nr:flagellar basal body-associated FliL family protein [Rhodopirellula sp.]